MGGARPACKNSQSSHFFPCLHQSHRGLCENEYERKRHIGSSDFKRRYDFVLSEQ